jgi:penicillin-binding protein 2
VNERSTLRLTILTIFVAALMVSLGGRLAQLVFVRGPDLAEAAQENRTRTLPDPAPRGLILDSSGRPMVGNTAAAGVQIDRAVLARQPDHGEAMLDTVAGALGLTSAQLHQRLTSCADDNAPPRPICDDGSPLAPVTVLGKDEAALLPIGESPDKYPGVTLTSTIKRSYPQRDIAGGQLFGYLGELTADEIQAADSAGATLTSADRVGRGGLEQQYDSVLRGASGQRSVIVDSRGRTQGVQQESPAVAGSTLVTSIDARLQARVERELRNALALAGNSQARGAAVVLDARTGRVLALSSEPDFDPREWVDGITQARYDALSKAGALLNYPLQATSPPGSAFKPITVVAMQREGFDLHGTYDCPSSYTVGGRTFSNFESEAHGRLTLRRAIEVSCNTVFYRAGDRMWRQGGGERDGDGELDPVAQAAVDLRLGQITGIDAPSEASGLLASPDTKHDLWQQRKDEWCAAARAGYPDLRRTDPVKADYFTALDKENCATGQLWRQGDAINAAIGQGLTAVTPLQVAIAYEAIANGGDLNQPTIARAVIAPDGTTDEVTPRTLGRAPVDPATLRFLRTAMAGVPLRGTAAPAFAGFPLDRYPVAGKTGSAQVEGRISTSWFASFAPANDPRYVVVAMITNGGTGAQSAAPAVRGIYESLFGVGVPAVFPRSGPPTGIPDVQGVTP